MANQVFSPNKREDFTTLKIVSTYKEFTAQGSTISEYLFGEVFPEPRVIDGGPRIFLHHYSPLAGVEAILKNSSMWATDARYLNDSHELSVAIQKVKIYLPDFKPRIGNPAKDFAYSVIEEVAERNDLYSTAASRVYVACFCADDDVLSQWRGYGGDTLAYSLGFDLGSVLKLTMNGALSQKGVLKAIAPVLYYDGDHGRHVKTFISQMMVRLEAIYVDPASLSQRTELVQVVRRMLTVLDVFLKNSSFSEEKEWRYAIIDVTGKFVPTPSLRATKYGLAPYIELKSSDPDNSFKPIKIRQGPTAWPKLGVAGMNELLRQRKCLDMYGDILQTSTTGSSYR